MVKIGATLGLVGLALFAPAANAFMPRASLPAPAKTLGRSRGAMFAKDPFQPQQGADLQPGVGGPQAAPELEKVDEMTDYLLDEDQKKEYYAEHGQGSNPGDDSGDKKEQTASSEGQAKTDKKDA